MKAKVEHLWSVLCEKSFTDIETHNVSMINSLEQLQVMIDPLKGVAVEGGQEFAASVVPIDYELVTLWHRTVKTGEIKVPVKVDIISPTGNILTSLDYNIEMSKEQNNYRFRSRFLGMKITTPGVYKYVSQIRSGNVFKVVGMALLDVRIGVNPGKR